MLKFPDEEERSEEVQRNLCDHFAYSNHIYEYWIRSDTDQWIRKAELPHKAALLSLLLNLQAFRLYRSAIDECRRAEAFSARILTRCLYETYLALLFVLKKNVCLRLNPVMDKKTGARVLDKDGRPKTSLLRLKPPKAKASDHLTREFRATLYFAHAFIEKDRYFQKMAVSKGFKRLARGKKARRDPKEMAQIESEIGTEWFHVLNSAPYTYSGLRVSDLAEHLGLHTHKWYNSIYFVHSADVHAANAMGHMERDGATIAFRAFSTDEEVLLVLKGANILFRGIMSVMENEIGFGPGNPSAIAWFRREYDRVFRGKKSK